MLNVAKSISIAAIAIVSGLGLGTAPVLARVDDADLRRLAVTLPMRDAADRVIFSNVRGLDRVVTAAIAPQVPAPRPGRSVRPAPRDYNVFRSVVVPVGKVAGFPQWGKVQPAAGRAGDLCRGADCGRSAAGKLAAALETARGLDQVEALKLINRAVNRAIAYRADEGDRWQTLAQTAARGAGDCEDYAIAKMALLAQLGFAPEQLQFIVLKDTRRQLYHAVLAVHAGGKRYILDNLTDTAASDTIFRTYKPIVSFVGTKSYVHGFKGGETAVAMGKGGFASISLGN